MDITLNFEKDFKRVQRELGELGRKIIPRAANSALNKTATQARTAAVKELKQEIGESSGLSAGGFRKSIELHRSNLRTLMATLTASGRPLPLIHFGARQTKKGVTAKAWNKRKRYPGTFIAKMPNGKKGVFKRASRKRLPVKQLFGPSIPKAFIEQRTQKSLRRSIDVNWPKNFNHEIKYRLSRFNKK